MIGRRILRLVGGKRRGGRADTVFGGGVKGAQSFMCKFVAPLREKLVALLCFVFCVYISVFRLLAGCECVISIRTVKSKMWYLGIIWVRYSMMRLSLVKIRKIT